MNWLNNLYLICLWLAICLAACRGGGVPAPVVATPAPWGAEDLAECNGHRIAKTLLRELVMNDDPREWRAAVDAAVDASLTWAALTSLQQQQIQYLATQEEARQVALQGTRSNWLANLQQHRQTLAGWRLATRTDLALDEFNRAAIDGPLDPSAVAERYEKRGGRYIQGEQVLLSELALPSQRVEARQGALDVKAAVVRGEPFAEAAAQTALRLGFRPNGDRDWTLTSALDPQLAAALRTLQPGQVSEPVQTSFGWHLLLLRGRRPERALPLAEARPLVEAHLRQERAFVLRRQTLAKLRQHAVLHFAPIPGR